jgi:hypothetical protein
MNIQQSSPSKYPVFYICIFDYVFNVLTHSTYIMQCDVYLSQGANDHDVMHSVHTVTSAVTQQ